MISQPVFPIFTCSPLPSGTCRTPGLSIPWCCLPTSSSVCLVSFPFSLCLARWFWPDLMNGKWREFISWRHIKWFQYSWALVLLCYVVCIQQNCFPEDTSDFNIAGIRYRRAVVLYLFAVFTLQNLFPEDTLSNFDIAELWYWLPM